ncbi:MAG: hypothetical protein ACLT4X_02935, partial [Phascolarctobacterium sp.]
THKNTLLTGLSSKEGTYQVARALFLFSFYGILENVHGLASEIVGVVGICIKRCFYVTVA